jgi:UDP-N-acetylmuramate dehydrogenase
MIFAAYYLDKVDVRGTLVRGNAAVSYQHANMIVATAGATSADIIAVARTMQERVYQQFGILLQPECQLIGFAEYPLHKDAHTLSTIALTANAHL